jgi:hypothetical protein
MENDNKCIINWELHQQINGSRKIDTKYKYERPKGGKKPGFFKRLITHIKKVFKGLNDLRKNGHVPRN